MSVTAQSSQDCFFVAELSDCAKRRIMSAKGKKSLETQCVETGRQKVKLEGAFITADFARAICAHCLKNGEIERGTPLPFRLFSYGGPRCGPWKGLREVPSNAILAHIGYRPKKKHILEARMARQAAVAATA